MKTRFDRITETVERFRPPHNRRFVTIQRGWDGAIFLRVEGKVRDLTHPKHPGKKTWQAGAEQYVAPNMSADQIWRMMLSMLIAFEEHEIREAVLVDGVRVFGPHIRIGALKAVAGAVEA